MHLETRLAEDVDSQGAHATGRAGDGEWTEVGRLPVVAHAVERQRGSETGGAQDHALAQAESAGQGNDPLRIESRVLGITAIACFAEARAGHQHRIAFLERRIRRGHHVACHVDAAYQRKAPQDLALTGAGERVLVVDRRIRGLDDHLAGIQGIQRNGLDAPAITGVVVVDAEGVEGGGRQGHAFAPSSRRKPGPSDVDSAVIAG